MTSQQPDTRPDDALRDALIEAALTWETDSHLHEAAFMDGWCCEFADWSKDRDFAYGQIVAALLPVIAAHEAQVRADAWDEGANAASDNWGLSDAENPYRAKENP